MNSLEIGGLFFMENQKVTWEGKEPMTKTGCPPERGCPREGWDEVGDPPPPSLVRVHGASRERISPYKRNRTSG